MRRSRSDRRCVGRLTPAWACGILLLWAGAAFAGIAVDDSSGAVGNAATLTWPHTVGSGGDRVLVVGVSIRNGARTVQGITYGGTPLSFVGARSNHDNAVRAEIWYLASPPAGTADVGVTLSGGAKMVGGAVSFFGVDPAAPLGTSASAFSTDTGTLDPSVTLSTVAGAVVVDVLASEGSAGWLSPSAGRAQRWNVFSGTSGGDAAGACGTAPGATSVKASWSRAAKAKWAIVAVPLRPAPATPTTLYLKGDGVPRASLLEQEPTQGVLPNYAPARDGYPGLLLHRTPNGWNETDPAKHQQWVAAPDGPDLDGPVSLVFWSAIQGFIQGRRGVADAYLLDCAPDGSDCSPIAQGRKDISDWSGGWGSWNPYSIDFGNVTHAIPAGRSLAVKLVAGDDAGDDMIFAYDATGYPSRLSDEAGSDIVIDCDFGDWSDAEGAEFDVTDQGGPDDWDSPTRLDITRFAVSSNSVDSFHVLFGFDDVPPQQATAATLIDTDVDGKANAALVATADAGNATVALYTCDNTLSDGCGAAVLARIYRQSDFCLGTGAGPWNDDSLLEATLPFHDLGFDRRDVVLTTLVSYAAENLLTAPKDAIFGASGQDYAARVHYDAKRGKGKQAGPPGANFFIRRDGNPSAVRAAAPHATVSRAPFDDDPGTLGDGQIYFYVVEREGGIPLDLSATPNRVAGAPRIGFDDGDPYSSPVDARRSTVSVDASSIPADGTSFVTVTVVPRDGDGVLLGAGLDVRPDGISLAPGMPAGPVEDNRNGSYTLRISSTGAGLGDVRIAVEGIVLDAQAQVAFTAP